MRKPCQGSFSAPPVALAVEIGLGSEGTAGPWPLLKGESAAGCGQVMAGIRWNPIRWDNRTLAVTTGAWVIDDAARLWSRYSWRIWLAVMNFNG